MSMAIKKERRVIHKTTLADQLHRQKDSLIKRYQDKVLGSDSLLRLLGYEMAILLFSNLPGAVGYALRKIAYKRLFRKVGGGVIFGKGMAIRYPGRITLGDRVAIDDNVMLDAWGAGDEGVTIGDDVIISRNCVVQGKMAPIRIGARTDVGCNTVMSSVSGIYIGDSVLIAGNCYIGGGRYTTDRIDIPMMDQGLFTKGPVEIGDDCWLGAGAVVLDGVKLGRGCIVGAGAVVTRDVPDYAIVTGVPARVVGTRGRKQPVESTCS